MNGTEVDGGALVLTGGADPSRGSISCSHFHIVAFSDRSPAKTTANEDSALVMSYGDDSVILGVADGAGGCLPVSAHPTLPSLHYATRCVNRHARASCFEPPLSMESRWRTKQ